MIGISIRQTAVPVILLAGLLGSLSSQNGPAIGHAAYIAREGRPIPTATALFSFTNPEGVLLWEAGVEAVGEDNFYGYRRHNPVNR